ncbi:MAG: hypothetical protein JW888_00975 [Pirellulales bacterium]|nr:hypothetical protein [Pirellulales bacterium]
MNRLPRNNELPPQETSREISQWARVYGQNRSLGVVVFMIVALMLSAAIGVQSYLAGVAYRAGHMTLFWASIAVVVSAVGATIFLSVPRWGGRLQERVVNRLYAGEGNVALSTPARSQRHWGIVLAACFGSCVTASIALGFVYDIPSKYMQPISALYVVPFLVGLWFLMRPMAGCVALLWPALYGFHAILILAGAPIAFTGRWEALNVLIPIAGYGMLAGLLGHLYSRVALGRLRRLTQADPTSADRSGRLNES